MGRIIWKQRRCKEVEAAGVELEWRPSREGVGDTKPETEDRTKTS